MTHESSDVPPRAKWVSGWSCGAHQSSSGRSGDPFCNRRERRGRRHKSASPRRTTASQGTESIRVEAHNPEGKRRDQPGPRGQTARPPAARTHLLLHVVERIGRVDCEADQDDVGVGIREWTQTVVVLLSRGICSGYTVRDQFLSTSARRPSARLSLAWWLGSVA